MEYVIGIILGIFAIGFLIFRKRKNRELDLLKEENEKLSVDLEDTERGKAGLENQLTEKTAQVDSLTNELGEANTQIGTLNTQIDSLNSYVREAEAQINTLTDRLERANTQIGTLTNRLERANTQIGTLTNELERANTQIDSLNSYVREAEAQINTLTDQLEQVSESNANALKALHLFELLLQLNVFVLYSEVSRAVYFAKEYKELYEEYKGFLEQVEKRTKRRLVRTGIGAAMSLIPGIGIFQLGADIVELADFVNTVAEGATDFSDVLGAVNSSLNIIHSLGNFIDFSEIGVLRAEISSDEDREKVMQRYQSVFEEVFRQNREQDLKEPDASDFDNFLQILIKRMKEFVDSMPESARRRALNRIVGDFKKFGIRLHPSDESPKIRADRSLPPPKN